MNSIHATFSSAVLVFIAFAFPGTVAGQDLPGTPLPGTPVPVAPAIPPAPGEENLVEGEIPKPAPIDPKTIAELKSVISSNVYALQKRNLNMALSTIHPESPTMETSRDMFRYMFARYVLKYTLQKIEVLEVRGDEARVQLDQITQKIEGRYPFRDNRVRVIHTLKRDGQKWKLFSSEAILIQYLTY